MTLIKRAVITFFLSALSLCAYAEWTPASKIVYLSIKASGDIHVKLDKFDGSASKFSCAKDTFILRHDAPGFDARADALLFIYAAGKAAELSYYGCHGDYYSLSSITLRKP